MIQLINSSTNNTTLENAEITLPSTASGIKKSVRIESNAQNLTLPAGAYTVQVKHIDPIGGSFTVNSNPLDSFNDSFHDTTQVNEAERLQDFVPEVIIVNPSGVQFLVVASYPSTHPFNPENF